jgi:hypothetical protein
MMALGDAVLGKELSHEDNTLSMELVCLKEETQELTLSLWSSPYNKLGSEPHQTLNLPSPSSWTSSLYKCEKQMFVV